jgi:CubicO group peptidase (beta-lactamase class C family)
MTLLFRDHVTRVGAGRLSVAIALLLTVRLGSASEKRTDTSAQVTPRSTRTLIHAIERKVPETLKQNGVPGAAVAIIRKGEVVWMSGFGMASLETRTRVTPGTIFNVGSLSKTPAAWAVMQLVERGEIRLDTPIDQVISRWHLPPSTFDSNAVTIERLLSHTSGISNHDYHGWDPGSALPPIEDSLAGKTGTGEVRVVSAPGSGFHYSGANFAILELLLEEKSGQALTPYMQSHIFAPLHMNRTQYGLPADAAATMATPYDSFGKPLPLLRYNELAAAGLTTDLHDLASFAAAALPDKKDSPAGRGLLRPSTLKLMETAAPNTMWAQHDPYGPSPQYGLGYTVRPNQLAGHTGVGHGGTNSGWESLVQIIPDTGDGLIVMTNSSNGSAVIADVMCVWRQWASRTAACPQVDVQIPLCQAYIHGGAKAAVSLYRKLRSEAKERYDFSAFELNGMGYRVMRLGDLQGAITLFKLNVESFPQDWNVYDSLGEAYAKAGDKADAIANYRRSLQLNPSSESGQAALKQLEAQ